MEAQTEAKTDGITKDTTIGEIVEKYPVAIDILTSFGVHCVGCHVSPFESLEMGFKGHGMTDEQIEEAVTKINAAIKDAPATESKPKEPEFDVSTAKIDITDKAAQKIKEFLETKKKQALRISVVPGGCSGFSYGMELDDEKTDDDIVISEKDIKVYVDKSSMAKLNGATVDYVESLKATGFKIENPNAESTCGCGSSFG